MALFEEIQNRLLTMAEGKVKSISLSWKGCALLLGDGRWGIGAVPPGEGAALSPREDHTRRLLDSSARDLVGCYVSPYPQEFAAASAAAAALAPPGEEGLPMEYLLSLPQGERVSLLSPDPWVTDFLKDWSWNIAVFDDHRRGVDVRPEWTASQYIRTSPWVWLTAEALRSRLFFTLLPWLKGKRVILQGPGIPFLPEVFAAAEVSFLVLPRTAGVDRDAVIRYVAAGGTPWNCPGLPWGVYPLSRGQAL